MGLRYDFSDKLKANMKRLPFDFDGIGGMETKHLKSLLKIHR